MTVTERRDLMVATKSVLCCTGERETDCVCTGSACAAGAFAAASGCLQPARKVAMPGSRMLKTMKRLNDRPHLVCDGTATPSKTLFLICSVHSRLQAVHRMETFGDAPEGYVFWETVSVHR